MTPIPVLPVAGMRAWERATWDAGVREDDVIARVGAAVAAFIRRHHAPGTRLLLLCGRGHNGDDLRAALPHLAEFTVDRIDVRDPVADLPAVVEALGRDPGVILDGLFGIGLSRPLDAGWQALVETVNAARKRVVAMDVPSGLDAATGRILGAAVRADVTLTVGAPKTGMLAGEAAECVGRIEVLADVGLVPWNPSICAPDGWFGSADEFSHAHPRRSPTAHKGHFGHVCIIAGSTGYHGAAVLAARGALRARPGLVTVLTAPETYIPVASQLSAAMVRPWMPGAGLPGRTTAVVVGPGLADPTLPEALRTWIADGWRSWSVPVIADASALDWLPPGPFPAGAIRVLTPHPGEAARLLGTSASGIQDDRRGSALRLSARYGGAWVLLKGQGTIVVREGALPWWNSTGNPGLAQGGSGDVLAGFLGGLLAQPSFAQDPEFTLRGAVHFHGATADRLEATADPWNAEDLARAIRWDAA